MTRVALIGLDGATFRVLDPVMASGAMPTLAAMRSTGVHATLRSTVPTYTPPAWVSMATGVNPGRHGILGFLATTPQQLPRIAHSRMIDSPPLWSYLDAQGVTSGIFHVPMSYPPVPVRGFMVAGGLASGWTNPEMPNFTSDASTSQLVSKVAGDHYPLDTVVSYENDWRSTTIATQLQRNQEIRNKVLGALIEEKDPQVVFAVAEGPDRLQHLHYQYIVETSDWYNRSEAAEARDRALGFFSELDKGIGHLAEWAGPDGHVLIVS